MWGWLEVCFKCVWGVVRVCFGVQKEKKEKKYTFFEKRFGGAKKKQYLCTRFREDGKRERRNLRRMYYLVR